MAECHQVNFEEKFDISAISKLITLREDKVQRFLYKKRKFTLSSDEYYNISTGKTKDNKSILCLASKNTVCLFFDKNGNYLDSRIFKIALDDKTEIDAFLLKEYGYKDAPIKFKQFSFSHEGKTIEILPFNGYILEFFEIFESQEKEEKERNVDFVREWIFSNCYVLNCWNDYWVNGNGEITDS